MEGDKNEGVVGGSSLSAPVFTVENCSLKLSDGVSFEAVVGQLQYHHPEFVLCIEDGTILRIYPRAECKITQDKTFEGSKMRNGIMEYYFRCNADETLYCFFGEEAARTGHVGLDLHDDLEGKIHLG